MFRKTIVSVALVLFFPSAAWAVIIETVPVGNPGNVGELSGSGADGSGPNRICGAVGYIYGIGKFEVTAGQYCEFLNAVAKTDKYGLYNTNMDASIYGFGCNIQRSGSPGDYTYSVPPNWANRPVNFVSWGNAARFCNWLTNRQPTGDQDLSTTEDGSYYLNGATSDAELLAVTRKIGARYVIPSEDEWYKSAYHKNDGATGNYWDYPTGTNAVPSNDLIDPDPGNNANFSQDGYTIGGPYYRTPVGEFENSESPYSTFDQGGNVFEWTQAVLYGAYRSVRGGSLGSGADGFNLLAADRHCGLPPSLSDWIVGFRIAQLLELITFTLDILPGSDRNPFVPNEKGLGRIPMVIFTTEEVAAEDIIPESIKIAGVLSPVKISTDKDVDGDGIVDLVMHFSRRGLIDALSLDTYEAGAEVEITVTAIRLSDSAPIEATDSIVIVGPERGEKASG